MLHLETEMEALFVSLYGCEFSQCWQSSGYGNEEHDILTWRADEVLVIVPVQHNAAGRLKQQGAAIRMWLDRCRASLREACQQGVGLGS